MTLAEMARRFGYRAVLAVPVVSREVALGAVGIYWDEAHQPDEREIRLLTALSRQAGVDAVAQKRLLEALEVVPDHLPAILARADLMAEKKEWDGLIGFIEERFGVEIKAHETGADHLDTVSHMTRLIREKLGTSP